MANIFRLGVFSLLWVMLALPMFGVGDASASFTQPTGNTCDGQACETWCSSSNFVSDMAAANYDVSFHSVSYVSPPLAVCIWSGPGTGGVPSQYVGSIYQLYFNGFTSGAITPPNSSCSGGSCSCDSGYIQNATNDACVAQSTCPVGGNLSEGVYDYGTKPEGAPVLSACDSGCATTFTGGPVTGRKLVGGVYHYFGAGSYDKTGQTCAGGSSSATVVNTADPPTCDTGQTLGTVNGVSQCFTSSNMQPVNPNDSSSSSVTTPATVVSAAPELGTDYTREVTTSTGTDGKVTTQTVIKDGSGVVVTTTNAESAPVDPLKKFCELPENKNNTICSGGSFSGACDGTIACTGDAVQCATARAVFLMQCELSKTSASSTLGQQLVDGNDPLGATLPKVSNATLVNLTTAIDTTDALPGGSCVADSSFMLAGQEIVVPFSRLCTLFELMGYAMVLLAGLASARIIGVWG